MPETLARRSIWFGDEADAGGEDDEGDPEKVRAEEVQHLHPGGCEEGEVGEAEEVLEGEEKEDSDGEGAVVGPARAARSQSPKDEPDDESAGDEADGRVQPANLEEPGAAGGEILRDGGEEIVGGVERVTEGGERAGDADDEGCDEAGEGEARGADSQGSAHGARVAGEEVRGEGERGDEEQRVGEVEREIDGA